MALVAVLAAASATPAAQALAGAVAIGDVTPAVNWNDSNDLVIGNAAFGSLLIESPATIVRSASGWLGSDAGRRGHGDGLGPGRVLEVNGRLVVGANGSGTLMLANQGMVSAGANGQGVSSWPAIATRSASSTSAARPAARPSMPPAS